jgi:glycine amidinotransferase
MAAAKHHDRLVWRWNDFDPLEEVVVGIADNACFPPLEPACQSEYNDQYTQYGAKMSHPFSEHVPWPTGPKLKRFVDKANQELDGMVELLEGEGIFVHRPDKSMCEFNTVTKTPDFESPNQYCVVCPRDVLMTVGNEIVEATMCKRSRYFEFRAYRPLIRQYFDNDPRMIWTAAPKPMMSDKSYTTDFWNWDIEERKRRMHEYTFCINEEEVLFDAADCMLLGDVMFVQQSMVTNLAGIRWLKRHFAPQGIEVRTLHFPYDLFPSHIDCTFVAVREGLCLTNPDRPVVAEEVKIFKQNDWKMVDVPFYSEEQEHPICCQSSRWLSMNVFSISPNKIVVEAGEKKLIQFLEMEHGFDVLAIPYRGVFEFGGSLHCSTWDIRRRGDKKSYFTNREDCENDIGMESLTNLP